ncbi:MAG: monovalent cation/H+ antiporter complex subunit F [Coriobacteriia bacterium]|nr:monovalent cation/H+ antiporter complex subunit F [Coriobacteriia bacterium]
MSDDVFVAFAAVLLGTIIIGLIRVERGPSPADRMLAAQLFGTAGVAMLLLLSEGMQTPALRDVALVFALLAAMAAVAFVKRAWHQGAHPPGQGDRQ